MQAVEWPILIQKIIFGKWSKIFAKHPLDPSDFLPLVCFRKNLWGLSF